VVADLQQAVAHNRFQRRRKSLPSIAGYDRHGAVAAKCFLFGLAFRQNQTGSATSASKADDWLTLATTETAIESSEKHGPF
jgi:hypothetical protein